MAYLPGARQERFTAEETDDVHICLATIGQTGLILNYYN